MPESSPVDLRHLNAIADFLSDYTPSSTNASMFPALQQHILEKELAPCTAGQLSKAVQQCKRTEKRVGDDRAQHAAIREKYDRLEVERAALGGTRAQKATWREEHEADYAAYNDLAENTLSAVDTARLRVAEAYRAAHGRATEASAERQRSAQEEKQKKQEDKAERKRRRQERAQQAQAEEHLRLKEAKDKSRAKRAAEDEQESQLKRQALATLSLMQVLMRHEAKRQGLFVADA